MFIRSLAPKRACIARDNHETFRQHIVAPFTTTLFLHVVLDAGFETATARIRIYIYIYTYIYIKHICIHVSDELPPKDFQADLLLRELDSGPSGCGMTWPRSSEALRALMLFLRGSARKGSKYHLRI